MSTQELVTRFLREIGFPLQVFYGKPALKILILTIILSLLPLTGLLQVRGGFTIFFPEAQAQEAWRFRLAEATIADVHRAIKAKQLTVTQLVNFYMKRIQAYNGPCVKGDVDPVTGLQLGAITPIENAGQVNALMTLNIRGKRSKTDPADNDPKMPDALEVAKALDAEFARTGKLAGPLHGIPFAIKDQFDTFDMRTTSASGANYANDRPPRDSEVVARLRKAGAIILAKANMGEYAAGDRSTWGGTICNPYDTTRSAGRSSGGSGAAVAANLVMCAIGEETGPSGRNPATNNSLVGILATHSLVSRAGLIPASLTRDRPAVLCRNVTDAAIVLGVLAGYDYRDPATAACVGRIPQGGYASSASPKGLKGFRIGVVREFMQPFNKADEDSVRIANQAIADLAKAGAVLVDPGPNGQLFQEAIAKVLPSLDPSTLMATYKELFSGSEPPIKKLSDISGNPSLLPPELTLRILSEGLVPTTGEVQYALNDYLRERGDRNMKTVEDLINNATFFTYPLIDGVAPPPKNRLEDLVTQTQRLTKKSDGTPFVQKTPITRLDITGWHTRRTILQMLIFKVMADHKLDALVFPTKTIPAPILEAPVEATTVKSVSEPITVTIEGVEYSRNVERVIDARYPLAWRLSPNSGFPSVVVPAGFTREVYDRAPVVGKDGNVKGGDLVGPKAIQLPVAIEFLGRPFSESVLIKIASAYESATHHRRTPKSFRPLPGEP